MMRPIPLAVLAALAVLVIALGHPQRATAQIDVEREVPCCEIKQPGVVWAGTDTLMTAHDLAAYCAPILWFSPDEPLLREVQRPEDINVPTNFPFEPAADGPVGYFRVRTLIKFTEGEAYLEDTQDRGASQIDLSKVSAINLDYFFYYPWEEGLGRHVHDVESVEMKVIVYRQPRCAECRYGLYIGKVTGKAHGILWYDNTLEVDDDTRFPLHILVEEGKHASCTDKNGDGYFTPGYDVNKRVNDAWGVRDVMRTGALFSAGYQSWFTKIREPETQVFPPLPPDSRIITHGTVYGDYEPGPAVYSLRPYPYVDAARDYPDPHIMHFVDKGYDDWPDQTLKSGLEEVGDWLEGEEFVKSLSISYRLDNNSGISFVFPLLIVKNINDPISGGWLVNRIYLKDKKLRDFGWNVLYTPSASRWLDPYFSAGLEVDDNGTTKRTGFITESGLKFRFNISTTPLRFLKPLTDFWGLRFGVRYIGFQTFSEIGYVVEVGAGTF